MQKSVAEINLGAIYSNALKIKRALNGKLFYAVVKADAYGHGAPQVAKSLSKLADAFCVAIAEEGIALRTAGISNRILVFTPPRDGYDCARFKAYNLTATVNSADCARLIDGLDCEIKVNTGMNRIGCNISELDKVLSALKRSRILGVYSHLYAADSAADSYAQLSAFRAAAQKVNRPAHISASGGFLRGGKYIMDGVRCGILLYGYSPQGFTAPAFKPAMKVYADKIQTTEVFGGGAGYAKAVKKYKTLSTYRLGYAEGFSRKSPFGVGNLCMDSFVSQSDSDRICVLDDAQSLAEELGTIPYEILTSATIRSERVYI